MRHYLTSSKPVSLANLRNATSAEPFFDRSAIGELSYVARSGRMTNWLPEKGPSFSLLNLSLDGIGARSRTIIGNAAEPLPIASGRRIIGLAIRLDSSQFGYSSTCAGSCL